jgi:hypothetical protein
MDIRFGSNMMRMKKCKVQHIITVDTYMKYGGGQYGYLRWFKSVKEGE